MRHVSLVFFFLLSTLALFAQTDDKQAIIKIIELEHQYFCERNYEKLASTFDQSEFAFHGNGIDRAVTGWETISKEYQKYFKTNSQPVETSIFYDYEVWIAGDKAWASFYKKGKDETSARNREMRGLVKKDGEWKVVSILAFSLQ